MNIIKTISLTVGLLPYLTQGQSDRQICNRVPALIPVDKDVFFDPIDIGACTGACRSTGNYPRVCKPKSISSQIFRYKKTARCDCITAGGTFADQNEVQTQKPCDVYSNYLSIGPDASGNDVTIDIGQCLGGCTTVPDSRSVELEIKLTADDIIDEFYVDGNDKISSLTGANSWTTIDTHIQTVSRWPASGHVIAVKASDASNVVNGFLASVQYDAAIQHVTGSGMWISTTSEPNLDTNGKEWYEPGYVADLSTWATAQTCMPVHANVWGTYWPDPLYADGAQWIWGPSTTCDATARNPTPTSWFLLKFHIDFPQECKPTAMAIGEVVLDVVKECECRCNEDPQDCLGNYEWNEFRCNCECPLTLQSCPDGTVLNREKCICEDCFCDAKQKEECLEQQCLYTFYPYNLLGEAKAGECIWYDFNGDSKPECGCPQNNCQLTKYQKLKICAKKLYDVKKICAYDVDRPKGSRCDSPGLWAPVKSLKEDEL